MDVVFDLSEIEAFVDNLEGLSSEGIEKALTKAGNEITGIMENKVKRLTPTGIPPRDISEEVFAEYWSGYTGGSLRDHWKSKPVRRRGKDYICMIYNNSPYAMYVEYGHRQTPGRFVPALGKRLKTSFVPGKYMARKALAETRRIIPDVVKTYIKRAWEDLQP